MSRLEKVLFCLAASVCSMAHFRWGRWAAYWDKQKKTQWVVILVPYSLFVFLLHLVPPHLYLSLPRYTATPTLFIPPFRSPWFLLPLSSPVQWRFNDAVIHSCSRHCVMVMWPKPAWQHGEQHSLGWCVCARGTCTCSHSLVQARTGDACSHLHIPLTIWFWYWRWCIDGCPHPSQYVALLWVY